MEWGTVGQVGFFISTTLLAVVVTVFVFAASLLRTAAELAAGVQQKEQEKQKNITEEEFNKAEKDLLVARRSQDEKRISELTQSLNGLRKRLKTNKKALENIRKRYLLPITFSGGVVFPGLCFLLASIFSGIAWSLAGTKQVFIIGHWQFDCVQTFLVMYSLVAIFGIYRLCVSLRIIQEISITSGQVELERQARAIQLAQEKLEAESKPQLTLSFDKPKPPIQIMEKGMIEFVCEVNLAKGQIARQVKVIFLAPEGFVFSSSQEIAKRRQYPTAVAYPNYLVYEWQWELFMEQISYYVLGTIQAPPKSGSYTLAYRLRCERFTSDFTEFNIEVTPDPAQNATKAK